MGLIKRLLPKKKLDSSNMIIAVVVDCIGDYHFNRQHPDLQYINTPLLALISKKQNLAVIVYENNYDDYINFPIIEKQLYFRTMLSYNYFLSSSFSEALPPDNNDNQISKNLNHLKLANECANYLLENLGKEHKLSQLATTLGTNRNSLSIAFKAIFGKGVFNWLREQRLNKARQLLCTTAASVQSIAYELGFSDPANFSRTYKQEFDISPGQTRKQLIFTNT